MKISQSRIPWPRALWNLRKDYSRGGSRHPTPTGHLLNIRHRLPMEGPSQPEGLAQQGAAGTHSHKIIFLERGADEILK